MPPTIASKMFLKKTKTFFFCCSCVPSVVLRVFFSQNVPTRTFLKRDISKKICYVCITIQTPTMKTQMSVALKSYDDLNNRFMYRYLI